MVRCAPAVLYSPAVLRSLQPPAQPNFAPRPISPHPWTWHQGPEGPS